MMLVLSRRPDEVLYITDNETGEQIKVVLVRIESVTKARIGIVASNRFTVQRKELVDGNATYGKGQ